MALFALPFAAVGAFSGYSALRHAVDWYGARDWTPAAATILGTNLVTHSSEDSTTYTVEATYRYDFGGEEYYGDRVWFDDDPDNIGDFHQEAYAELSRHAASGEPWIGFVDPDEPAAALLFRDLRPGLLLFQGVFLLLFGGVGFGLLAAIPYVSRRLAEDDLFREQHPQEPWLWREEWRGPRIRSSARRAAALPLVFAVFWNLIAWPILLLAGDEIFDPENRVALLALLFPLTGVGLAVWAARSVLRGRRFGDSELELTTVPIPAGGRLAGQVLCDLPRDGGLAPRLRLTCHERRGSGDESEERIVWQDEMTVAPDEISFDGFRTRIPVSIDLPAEARESGDEAIRWVLDVTAPVPGIDYAATFEVPVFGRQLASPGGRERKVADGAGPRPDELGRGVEVTLEPHGGHRYLFRRARRKGAAAGLTLFAAVWMGAVLVLRAVDAPSVIQLVFAAGEVLVLLGVIDLWLTQRRVGAGPEGLSFRPGLFALGRRRTVPARDIESLRVARGLRSGNRLFYRILLKTADERNERTIASKLDNHSTAQAILERIERDLDRDGVRRAG